jgi:ABC-2 type transport system ATP-binding protein
MEELIDTFEMREYVDGLTETYSHGMRQRLVFASALLHRPRVLVVDEPMVGLDPKSVRIVKDLLKKAAQEGTAIFMSTHTLAIAEEMAHRIGIFHHGRLIRCGSIEELRKESVENQTLEDFFLQVTAESEVTGEGVEPAAERTPAEKRPA